MNYLIIYFEISLFLYFFKLFKHSKYMIIFHIGSYWNFDGFQISKLQKLANFRNCKIWEIDLFSKLEIF